MQMQMKVLPGKFTVCQIPDISCVPFEEKFTFLSRTDDELSLVCSTASVPAVTLARKDGWRVMKIEGVLDFSLVGILSRITGILAQKKISVFAVSTFNTDYVLVTEENLDAAVSALREAGYQI